MKTIQQFSEEIYGRMSEECHYFVMNYVDKLHKDRDNLQSKLRENIPVERIKGLKEMVAASMGAGFKAFEPTVKDDIYCGPKRYKFALAEDHNALKAEVAIHTELHEQVLESFLAIQEKVTELEVFKKYFYSLNIIDKVAEQGDGE